MVEEVGLPVANFYSKTPGDQQRAKRLEQWVQNLRDSRDIENVIHQNDIFPNYLQRLSLSVHVSYFELL